MAASLTTATPSRDAVRIKVIQHSECEVDSQCCRFSVDPELTGYEVLRNLIARAFDLKGDYQTCYLARDDRFPEACWVPLLSDFDLEMAFVKSADPYLLVRVDLMSSNGTWEAVTSMDIPKLSLPDLPKNNYSVKLPVLFKEKMEKTLSAVQKVLSWNEEGEDSVRPARPPLTDSEFQQMLNGVGQLAHPKELRLCVYHRGLEPSLRKVVWKHLLNVYPEGLTGRERLDYMKQKTKEYEGLKAVWQEHLQNEELVSEEVKYVTNMVRKDVLRTDRHHPYFSGTDDNINIQSLSNILTTYALHHPSVGYCQGMSDLASPLLVTMRDEAQAYVCFCALMARVHSNFHIDGVAMTLKFQHLTEALIFYDEEYYAYLRLHQADDLLFCYRWLLLELKREFAFDDALHMLEVLWSSLPPDPPEETLPLLEVQFNPVKVERPVPPPTPRQNHFANVCALRRQRSTLSNRSAECLAAILSRRAASMECDGPEYPAGVKKLSRTWSQPIDTSQVRARVPSGETAMTVDKIREESSSPEDSPSRNTRKIKNLREFQLLTKVRDSDSDSNPGSPLKEKTVCKKSKDTNTKLTTSNPKTANSSRRCFSDSDATDMAVPMYSDGGEVDVWQNPVATLSPEVDQHLQIICQEEKPSSVKQLVPKANGEHKQAEEEGASQNTMTASVNSCEEVTEVTGWQVTMSDGSSPHVTSLLPPEEFGGGNPFLMFLCVTLLLQHRNHIIKNKMDHNELAMYFDKMVRQHNVTKVLGHARRMYENYLKLDFSKMRSKTTPPGSSNDHSC